MINIIGLGYIGLPTALMFAAHGVNVVGTDYNSELVDTLNHGKVSFEEKGLQELYDRATSKEIKFSTDYQKTDVYIVAVPTPYNNTTKQIDPKYVQNSVKTILDTCPKGAIIVIESTVSPGTIDKFIRPIISEKGFVTGEDVHIVHAPERIIPGNMIYELEYNSRTIGADDKAVAQKIKDLYASFCKGDIVITDIRSAEMSKVVENTFRDINIAFANELAKICRHDNMDVYEIIKIANKHPRVNILTPGPGVGGHCISVDPWFLVGDYPDLAKLILQARLVNDSMPEFVLSRMHTIMKEHDIKNLGRVGLYGLTYKENVDDTRESPSLQLIENMEKHLASGLKVYDPWVKKNIVENQYQNFDEFLNEVDFIVVMVGHSHLLENIDKIQNKIILDTRNILNVSNVYKL